MPPGSLSAPSPVPFSLWKVMSSLWRIFHVQPVAVSPLCSTSSWWVLAELWHYVGTVDDSLGSGFNVTLSFCDSACIFLKLVPITRPAAWRPLDLPMFPYSTRRRSFWCLDFLSSVGWILAMALLHLTRNWSCVMHCFFLCQALYSGLVSHEAMWVLQNLLQMHLELIIFPNKHYSMFTCSLTCNICL